MKRYMTAAGAIVAVAAMAGPAAADRGRGHHNWTQPTTVQMQSNSAVQKAEVEQESVVIQKGGSFAKNFALALSGNSSNLGQTLIQSNQAK